MFINALGSSLDKIIKFVIYKYHAIKRKFEHSYLYIGSNFEHCLSNYLLYSYFSFCYVYHFNAFPKFFKINERNTTLQLPSLSHT